MLKHRFEIIIPHNIDLIIDKLNSYYGNNPDYYLSKDNGFFIIDRKVKSIAAPSSRIGNMIQFKIESLETSKSKVYGFIKPSSESQGFIISLLISMLIVIVFLINDLNKSSLNSERILLSIKWIILITLFLLGIISLPKRSKANIENEFKKIMKIKNSENKKYITKNYCSKCNLLEEDFKNGICSKCGRKLTTIV